MNTETELKIKDLMIKKERTKHMVIFDAIVVVCILIALIAYTVSMFINGPIEFKWYHAVFYICNPMWLGFRIADMFKDIGKVLDISNEIWDLEHPEAAKRVSELFKENE